MRVRLLLHAVLSSPRRKGRWIAASAAATTAAALSPLLVSSTPTASAELTAEPQLVQVALSAPATITRGAATDLLAQVTLHGVALPGRSVQFLVRSPGDSTWQVLGSATTGTDGRTTLPVHSVDAATEYGAYYAEAGGAVKSETASTVVHVIDMQPQAPAAVPYNARVAVSGHLLQDGAQGLAGQPVQVRFRYSPRGGWSRTQWLTTNAAGVAALAGRFTRSFQVGIQFPGANGLAPSPLAVATVRVRPRAATAPSGFRFPFLNPAMATGPGSWSFDQGIDMFAQGQACGAAAKLVAVGDGTVIQTGIAGFGPTAPVIALDDGPFAGRNVYYGHTGHVYVHVGQHVHAGDLVAQIGCGQVGRSSAPHLEIGVSVPGGPPCCPPLHATASAMYKQLLAALRRS